jgi:hypothetical protein
MLAMAFLLNWFAGSAQDINSPYSHFGVGNLYSGQTSYNAAMGGIGIALNGHIFVNILNPASYGFFDSTSFIFQGGLLAEFINAQTDQAKASSRNTQLGYMLMGFPITGWLKVSLGITPYSRTGYLIYEDRIQEGVGRITNSYEASGGLNRPYIGLAVKPFKNFSVGLNTSFLFGAIDYQQVVDFPDSLYYYSFRVVNNRNVHDFLFQLGAQYNAKLSPSLGMTLGAVYDLPGALKTKRYLLAETFIPAQNEVDYIKDTVAYQPDQIGNLKFPMGLGGGVTLQNPGKWLAGLDVHWQKWEDFRSFGTNDSLVNSLQISTGAQFRPSGSSLSSYFERINYRIGLRLNKSYLELKDRQINDFGLTFGAGFPFKGSLSMINLGVEIGQRGTLAEGLIKENYFRISLGFSFYERWFIRSKFY